MKLLKLTIKNFRGLKGDQNIINFEGSDIIFLIGQNNVGKSTFLRAYEFFVSPKKIAQKEDFCEYNPDIPIEIYGEFLKEQDDDGKTDFIGSGRNAEPDWVANWVDGGGHIHIRKIWRHENGDFEKETFSPGENRWVPNGFGGIHTLFTKYAPQPIFINAMEDEKSLEEKVNKLMQDNYLKSIRESNPTLYDNAVNAIKELQSAITESLEVQNINNSIDAHFSSVFDGLHLRIEAIKDENIKVEDAFKKNHTVRVEHEGIERPETFLQNGHGVIRQALFNFIAFLKGNAEDNHKKYLILFEEPELFLHPRVAYKLRACLYELANNSPYQILCATHSPMMIDVSKPHASLIRVTKDSEGNVSSYQAGDSVFAADEETKERIQMINRMNPYICEAFYADKVLLVEGDTEAIVYRDLLQRFFMNEEVFVLNTGSKMNIPFFQKILTHFRIEHYPIHDTDSKLSKEGNASPAWTLNSRIWELVVQANQVQEGLSRRYVHNANFENAHHYRLQNGKDKPLSAYKFAKSITGEEPIPACLRWLMDILGEKQILHDPQYLEDNNKTIDEIDAENATFPAI